MSFFNLVCQYIVMTYWFTDLIRINVKYILYLFEFLHYTQITRGLRIVETMTPGCASTVL